MITQTFDLNLIPNSAPVVIHVDQYDHGTGRLIAKLYNGSTAYTPAAGATAIIQGKKPDGNGFMYDATLSGNTVTADLTNQMSVVAGRVFVQFVITENDNRTGTFVFFLDVQPSALPADTEMSTSEYQVIEELLETAQAINENFPYIGANGHWFYYDGEQGQYVDSGVSAGTSITVGTTTTLDAGDNAIVTNTGDNINAVFNFGIPKGEKGDDGAPGATPDISMTATADAVSSDTPTVDVTEGGTAAAPTFALAFHGLKGAQGVQGEEGPEGPAGNGIVSITKTGTSGLVDTYTILFTNGTTTTFTVTNGQDGQGSGDMTKAVYDSTNAVADAGGIVSYINGLDFDKYLALYGATSLGTTADLDEVTNLGTYYKATTTGKKAGEPSDLVAADKYTLIVMGAMTGDTPQTEQVDPVAQILVAYIDDTHETKIYCRGFEGYTGSVLFTPHWTTWKSLDSPDVSGKADKVSGATSGDFAGLDANGNLTDSGSKASDFAAAGAALPTGGTTGQALVKHSNTDYDTEWGDVLSISDQQVLGAWNLAKNTGASSSSIYGVDFTKNVDDTITANGTNDGTNSSTYIINASLPIKAGTYYLSGGVSANAGIQVYKSISPYTNYGKSEGSEVTVTIPEDTNVTIIAYVAKNATISNVVLKPMISLEPNQPYVPYVMTNRELTEKLTPIESSVTITASGATEVTGYNRIIKCGNTVSMILTVNTLTLNAYGVIGTIPQAYRPKQDVLINFIDINNSDTLVVAGVTTGGNILSRTSLTNSKIAAVNALWYVD